MWIILWNNCRKDLNWLIPSGGGNGFSAQNIQTHLISTLSSNYFTKSAVKYQLCKCKWTQTWSSSDVSCLFPPFQQAWRRVPGSQSGGRHWACGGRAGEDRLVHHFVSVWSWPSGPTHSGSGLVFGPGVQNPEGSTERSWGDGSESSERGNCPLSLQL